VLTTKLIADVKITAIKIRCFLE